MVEPSKESSQHKQPHEAVLPEALSIFRLNEMAKVYEMLTGLPFSVRHGDKTAFDHTTREVIFGAHQLASMGITDPLIVRFIMFHELGHFKELNDDPAGYRACIEESKRPDGLGKAYFRFYNALMDIYVNTNTRNKAQVYEARTPDGTREFSQAVTECYRTQLFPERDLSALPFSTQYSYYVLNMGMGTASDLCLSPEVRAEVEAPIAVFGERLSTRDIIDDYLVPALGLLSTKGWKGTISQRKAVIDRTLRPVFERLVALDQARGVDPNDGTAAGDLEGVEVSPEDLEKAVREVMKQRAEANKSDREKAADQVEKRALEMAQKHLTAEEAQDFAATVRRVQDTIVELAGIYKQIVREEHEYKKSHEGHYRDGAALDVDQAISQWGRVLAMPQSAEVMRRDVYRAHVTTRPQHIRNWLSVDLSGSMQEDMGLLRDLCVSFSGALNTLSAGASIGQHDLRGSLGIVGFADSAIDVLPLTPDPTYEHIAQAYKHLAPRGGTSEHEALRKIADEIRKDPQSANRVDIVIAVTDGDTSDPGKSRAIVRELEELGVKLLAFRFYRGRVVPDVMPSPEQESQEANPARVPDAEGSFGKIWGKHGHIVRSAAGVIPAVRRGLADLLRNY